MAYDNSVQLIGNVTREPEVKFLPTGQCYATFGLAVNESWQPKGGGDRQEKVHFFDVTCWGGLAENVGESIGKGARVVVMGKMDFQSWEADDGTKRNALKVLADEVSPSLRWATVQITKNERPDGGSRNPAGAERQAPSQSGGQPAQQRSQQSTQQRGNDGDPGPAYNDWEEEPF